TTVRTLRAFDAWFFADAAYPLVGARGCVAGFAGFPALEPPRVDVLTPTEEGAEQRDLLLRRGALIQTRWVLIPGCDHLGCRRNDRIIPGTGSRNPRWTRQRTIKSRFVTPSQISK